MAKQKGRDVLLKVEQTPGSGIYITVGGLRTKSMTINNEPVDVTDSDSAGARALLEGAGVNSLEVSGSGLFADDNAANLVRTASETNTHLNFQIVFPGDTYDRTYTGRFMIASFEQGGEYNQAMTFTATLQSDGVITRT